MRVGGRAGEVLGPLAGVTDGPRPAKTDRVYREKAILGKNRQPKLGLCPIGKFVFSHEDAIRQKARIQAVLRKQGVRFVDLDGVLPDGLVREQSHVDPVVRFFRQEDVDGLFMPHCNFGTEGAVGRIAQKVGVPVLLWGPRDEAPLPDGTRLRDTLCGLFASSKVLHKLQVPFTYIENCRLADEAFRSGLDLFLRAANVAAAFRRGMRIGHVGQRIDFFWTTIVSESELLERFNVEVLPLDMVAFVRAARIRLRKGREAYEHEAAEWHATAHVIGFADDEPLLNILAVRDEMLGLAEAHGLDGLAMQDFDSLVEEMGAYCFFANSLVSEHCPVACESDIHGAVSTILLERAALDGMPAFLADLTIRHPDDDNGVLLWHAGAPVSFKHPEERIRLGHHWILPTRLAGMPHFRLREGPITVVRFDGDRGRYQMAAGEGVSMEGPPTQNNYVWMKVKDWARWERTLMTGPFIHHAAMSYGHYAKPLLEACRFVPGLTAVDLDAGTKPG